ncbi:hypothetical protein ACFWG5_34455 [Streptomyces hydrogenans]|uniref:hypothetical protein n=1 Tax=Streptomyces TaxID=1883 RepID=UPI003629D7A3
MFSSLFNRAPKQTATGPSYAGFIAGVTTFVADLVVNDDYARAIFLGHDPMPANATAWANYPQDPVRVERRAHFGGPSPYALPEQHANVSA